MQNIIDCDLSDDSFPFFTSRLVKVGGIPCRAMRVSFVGELGYELHIPWDKCLPIYRILWKEGKKHNLRHAGYRALYSLSAEKGMEARKEAQKCIARPITHSSCCPCHIPCHIVIIVR